MTITLTAELRKNDVGIDEPIAVMAGWQREFPQFAKEIAVALNNIKVEL
jgi:hypothetical protein